MQDGLVFTLRRLRTLLKTRDPDSDYLDLKDDADGCGRMRISAHECAVGSRVRARVCVCVCVCA